MRFVKVTISGSNLMCRLYLWWYIHEKMQPEKTYSMCSWGKEIVSMSNMWLQVLSKISYEKPCCGSAWEKETIYMCNLQLQLFSKIWYEKTICVSSWGKEIISMSNVWLQGSQTSHMKSQVVSVHEKKKPFTSAICNYSCSLKGDMNRHKQSVHEG